MKKLLLCVPFLALMFQSCGNIEDEYMYDKGLYTINWEAAADSSSVTIINRFWNETGNYFNYESDGSSYITPTNLPDSSRKYPWQNWPQSSVLHQTIL